MIKTLVLINNQPKFELLKQNNMRKIKLLAVAIVLFLGATQMSAQSKIAHIDTQALVSSMPEMKTAGQELERISKTYETELRNLASTFEAKVKRYESEADSKSEEENMKRAQELQDMQTNIQEYRNTAMRELEQKEADIYQPLLEKAKKAIEKVGKAQGFDYILDSTLGIGVIMAEGKDLLVDVKKELNIK